MSLNDLDHPSIQEDEEVFYHSDREKSDSNTVSLKNINSLISNSTKVEPLA
jgi:hypothetical protein